MQKRLECIFSPKWCLHVFFPTRWGSLYVSEPESLSENPKVNKGKSYVRLDFVDKRIHKTYRRFYFDVIMQHEVLGLHIF